MLSIGRVFLSSHLWEVCHFISRRRYFHNVFPLSFFFFYFFEGTGRSTIYSKYIVLEWRNKVNNLFLLLHLIPRLLYCLCQYFFFRILSTLKAAFTCTSIRALHTLKNHDLITRQLLFYFPLPLMYYCIFQHFKKVISLKLSF